MTIISGKINFTNLVVNGTSGSFDFTADTDSPGPPIPSREFTEEQLDKIYVLYHTTRGPRGSGPRDIEYYTDQIIDTGGWLNPTSKGEDNIGYWTDKIEKDLEQHGFHK